MGLLRSPREFEVLDLNISTVNILRLGGTILGTTNSGDPFAFPMPDGTVRDRSREVIEGLRELGVEALPAATAALPSCAVSPSRVGLISSEFRRQSTMM